MLRQVQACNTAYLLFQVALAFLEFVLWAVGIGYVLWSLVCVSPSPASVSIYNTNLTTTCTTTPTTLPVQSILALPAPNAPEIETIQGLVELKLNGGPPLIDDLLFDIIADRDWMDSSYNTAHRLGAGWLRPLVDNEQTLFKLCYDKLKRLQLSWRTLRKRAVKIMTETSHTLQSSQWAITYNVSRVEVEALHISVPDEARTLCLATTKLLRSHSEYIAPLSKIGKEAQDAPVKDLCLQLNRNGHCAGIGSGQHDEGGH